MRFIGSSREHHGPPFKMPNARAKMCGLSAGEVSIVMGRPGLVQQKSWRRSRRRAWLAHTCAETPRARAQFHFSILPP
jgi:hypothetical protein